MSSYAIVETGSKQYWVEPESIIEVERFDQQENDTQVELEKVLLAKNGEKVQIGQPHVQGAKVLCEYLGEIKADKVYSFKFRRRKASRTLKGHRQRYARLRVKEIQL